MAGKIEDLTLQFLHLTAWEEKKDYLPQSVCRSWNGYLFEILNKRKRTFLSLKVEGANQSA